MINRTLTREQLINLRQNIIWSFNDGELRTLCFDLGVDYDNLPGDGKENKARELISYCERHGNVVELVNRCIEVRPNTSWGDLYEVTSVKRMKDDNLHQRIFSTDWDIFICYASEDKDSFARPLAKELEARGLKVWFDEFTLRIGDSLRRSIDKGLANTRYGVVILSPSFFAKEWPQKELDGLMSREFDGKKVILPIWHNITHEQIIGYSPLLADRLATSSSRGLEQVVSDILRVVS